VIAVTPDLLFSSRPKAQRRQRRGRMRSHDGARGARCSTGAVQMRVSSCIRWSSLR